ncbi:NadR type nicotinamide-nucleotide adenylyltransferase [Chitinivorax tropicus]|uniref:NadR type nicotinamide-nucleotide adenylyltransferase n=1 Tax=Chitinivorax tropicus TaxID=714531 RepID=A0A840MN63_9PROT|nr:AAA family ATPase [Chitinivorax tropicus]MBB5017623.1 NadR type nicotinamide-nucleotide adenylyltransferase [Chitinivorax tropicus]
MVKLEPTFRHGLVIGKFYPPHAGHYYLIRTAASYCQQVTVGVLPGSGESIALADRLAWMREDLADCPHVIVVGRHDDTPVDYHDPAIWDAHEAHFRWVVAEANRQRLAPLQPVDAVFASEPYVVELARRFQAVPVCLDLPRVSYPVSGTAVRASPISTWSRLTAPVKAALCKRIVVLGAESTGTTTLACDLTQALQARGGVWAATQWVPEFGREHTWNKLAMAQGLALFNHRPRPGVADLDWHSDEFTFIAATQTQREDWAGRQGSPVLICDTDALATTIWHERYMGSASAACCDVAARMPPRALYLLTDHEHVPFEDDGLRDGEEIRAWMTERFCEVLQAQSVPWLKITGSREWRLQQALQAIDQVLAAGWEFAQPLG